MLKLSWASVNEMANTINAVANDPKVDKVTSYRCGRIMGALKSNQNKMLEARMKVWERFADRDEQLNPKKDERGNFIFSGEKQKECFVAVEELFKSNFIEVKVYKLKYEDLKEHLTGADLFAIEEIVEGLPETV